MKVLQTQYKVVLVSVILGIFVGFIDASIDYFFFNSGHQTFGALLFFDVGAFGIYLRFSALLVFVIFGLFAANIIAKQKAAEDKFNDMYTREKQTSQNLEDEIKRRVEFNRALVHELKTPIVPVVAAAELLAEEVKGENEQKLVSIIQRGAATMSKRIDSLLDVARGELGMLVLEDGKLDMAVLVNQIAEDMRPAIMQRGIVLHVDIQPALPKVWADSARIEQVVMNLVTNALKYTKGGKIDIMLHQKDNDIILEVRDTGIGIAKENQAKLFSSYYRIEDGRHYAAGLGLGLALCKVIVELHGGKIWVESEIDKGSTFGFSLPLRKAQ
jgi:two-component system, OmpR family, clock-associated histidine kinase SasA